MPKLNRETRLMQNRALGAMLLWRFIVGYEDSSETREATPLPLLFVVLPILLHEETAVLVRKTQKASGLRFFADKFRESKVSASDLIPAIHQRALDMRMLSSESIMTAVATGLVSVDCDSGGAVHITSSAPKAGIPASIDRLLKSAEKLGAWCSQVSLHEVSAILRVGF